MMIIGFFMVARALGKQRLSNSSLSVEQMMRIVGAVALATLAIFFVWTASNKPPTSVAKVELSAQVAAPGPPNLLPGRT